MKSNQYTYSIYKKPQTRSISWCNSTFLLSGSEALVVVEGLDLAVAGVDGVFKGGYRKGTGVGVRRCTASSPSSRRSVPTVIVCRENCGFPSPPSRRVGRSATDTTVSLTTITSSPQRQPPSSKWLWLRHPFSSPLRFNVSDQSDVGLGPYISFLSFSDGLADASFKF